MLSCVRFLVTPWTIACQAPLSRGFSRQADWSGLPCPPPGDLPDPGIEPKSLCLLHWQAGSLPLNHLGSSYYSIYLVCFKNDDEKHYNRGHIKQHAS